MGRIVFGWPLLLTAHAVSTAVFLVLSIVAVATRPTLDAVFVGFCTTAFGIGFLGLLAGFVRALSASRYQDVSLIGVFFLGENAAPKKIRNGFLAILALQTLIAIGVAVQAPFSPLAFAVLVPQLGFGLLALHGGFLGVFPAKP